MSQRTECILWGFTVLVLAAIGVIFGMNLLPTAQAIQERLGSAMPLFFTWGIIGMTVLASVVLAGFLFVTGMKHRT